MEQLIPIVNKLQDVFGAIGQESIDLPQITVVGSQSAGKSSVLENIVGRDFLPRGTGIVTRRPLVLQLYCINPDDYKEEMTKGEEWGEFLHLPGQKFFDFNEIREEIIRETDRVTGKNKGISPKSINLKIFSPFVLNLTLVDLPGVTKVPTGDQPDNVEELIRNMCFDFISNPNAIILAVTAANQDLANSDALKLAKAVDPEGERTVGVLTKVDIMDHGTDCCDILENKVIPLKKGYIAVINRSQRDIAENLEIRKGLAKESAYFQSHSKYRTMLSKCGTRNLANLLNSILIHHIRDVLPEIKTRIARMLTTVSTNLDNLGYSIDDESEANKGVVLLNYISQFVNQLNSKVDGRVTNYGDSSNSNGGSGLMGGTGLLQGGNISGMFGSSSTGNDTSELMGGARISFIFHEIFGKTLRQLDPFDNLSDEDIRTAIANANGTRPSLFVPEISFDVLVRRQISRLEITGLQCLDMILDEMYRIIGYSEHNVDLSRFPELRERLLEVTHKLLKECKAPTAKMITNLIQIELSYINTSHPDFVGGKAAVAAAQQAHQHRLKASTAAASSEGGPAGPVQARPPSAPEANSGFMGVFNGGQGHSSSHGSVSSSREKGEAIRLPQVPDKIRCTNIPSDKERLETEIIKILIKSYFDIVKKNFMDLVPKTIMRFLVVTFSEKLHSELVKSLYQGQTINELMRETEEVASKRRALREMQDLLHRANEIVNEVRSFQPVS